MHTIKFKDLKVKAQTVDQWWKYKEEDQYNGFWDKLTGFNDWLLIGNKGKEWIKDE